MVTRTVAVLALALLLVLAGCAAVDGVPDPIDGRDGGIGDPGTTTDLDDPSPTETAGTNGTLSVHFINVGQSVSTLVVGPTGETMLIDSGDFTDDGEHVLAYLERHDVERIDHLVTSHADADHIGGHAAVIEHYETEADGIGAVYDPGIAASTATYDEYLDAIERHNVTLYRTLAGDEVSMEGVTVDVLAPPEGYLANDDRNENSLVLRVAFGRTSFLFTGDASAEEEAYLVEEYGGELRSTVLKAGHHGSSSSTGEALLDVVGPRTVVISSAYDSQYGHPHEETLRRLADRSIPTYWTAVHGDVVLESDGVSVIVSTQRNATTDALDLRDATPVEPGTTDAVAPRIEISAGGEPVSSSDASPNKTATSTPATITSTTTATDGGTPVETALAVASVNADAAGPDGDNLEDEYVVFENRGEESLDLSGWVVADEADHEYAFPDGFVLDAGASVTLRTGSGSDDETDLYWGAGSPILNNDGDTILVRDANGTVVLRHEYEG